MFGVVVGDIDVAGGPENVEVVLADAVADPVETHVHGATAFLFDRVVGNTGSTGIVGLHWCCWLGVPHGDENGAEHFGIFTVVKKCTEFGFGGGGHDIGHDDAVDMYGSVERCLTGIWWITVRWWSLAEEEIATDSGACTMD